MSRMKVGICGAPGTGKTPLAQAISREMTLPLIHQGSRELRELTGQTSKRPPIPRMNEVQRMEWQLSLIDYRLRIEHDSAEYVADATSLDLLVWYRMCAWLVPFDQKVVTENLLYQSMTQYDVVFYCPLWIDLVATRLPKPDDPLYVDPFNLETSDYILKGILSTHMHKGFKAHVLQKQDIDGRMDEVRQVLLPYMTPTGLAS